MIIMKYKIIAYATSVVAAIALCITALLGFKLINYKSVLENSGEDSVVVINVLHEVDGQEVTYEKAYFDILGKSLYSVLIEDKNFDVNNEGWINSIFDIKTNDKNSWMSYSTTHDQCTNNTITPNQCGLGNKELYLSNVNEFTFKYEGSTNA